MQIVRELADEGNPIAKIAFLTRLAESTVREILAQLSPTDQERSDRHAPEPDFATFLGGPSGTEWAAAG